MVKRQFDKNDRRKVIIVPDTKRIMDLFEPFYKEFQKRTESLMATFSAKEIEVIHSYLTRATELMKETKHKFNQQK